MAINIVMADDDPILVEGLENVLRREQDFQILAPCGNGDDHCCRS